MYFRWKKCKTWKVKHSWKWSAGARMDFRRPAGARLDVKIFLCILFLCVYSYHISNQSYGKISTWTVWHFMVNCRCTHGFLMKCRRAHGFMKFLTILLTFNEIYEKMMSLNLRWQCPGIVTKVGQLLPDNCPVMWPNLATWLAHTHFWALSSPTSW